MFFSIPSFTKLLILVCVVVISWKGLTWLQKRQEKTTHKKTFRDTIIEKMIKKMQLFGTSQHFLPKFCKHFEKLHPIF